MTLPNLYEALSCFAVGFVEFIGGVDWPVVHFMVLPML